MSKVKVSHCHVAVGEPGREGVNHHILGIQYSRHCFKPLALIYCWDDIDPVVGPAGMQTLDLNLTHFKRLSTIELLKTEIVSVAPTLYYLYLKREQTGIDKNYLVSLCKCSGKHGTVTKSLTSLLLSVCLSLFLWHICMCLRVFACACVCMCPTFSFPGPGCSKLTTSLVNVS